MRIGLVAGGGGGGGGFSLTLCALFTTVHPEDAFLFLLISSRVGFHSSSLTILNFLFPISFFISSMDFDASTLIYCGSSWLVSSPEVMSEKVHSASSCS